MLSWSIPRNAFDRKKSPAVSTSTEMGVEVKWPKVSTLGSTSVSTTIAISSWK